jgi:ketosteroid isomerase-like protein
MFTSTQLFGQEWSEEQKEVWKQVETIFDLYVKKDLEGIMDCIHDEFIGWANEDALPVNKASVSKLFEYQFKKYEVLFYEIKPVAINIIGNVAIVQFYYWGVDKYIDGKEINTSGRRTYIFMKEGDEWIEIGHHGGEDCK